MLRWRTRSSLWAVEAQAEIASPGLSLAFVGGFRLCAFDVLPG